MHGLLLLGLKVILVVFALNLFKDGWNTGIVSAIIVIALSLELRK